MYDNFNSLSSFVYAVRRYINDNVSNEEVFDEEDIQKINEQKIEDMKEIIRRMQG